MSDLVQGIQAYEELDFIRAYEILLKFAEIGETEAQKIIGHMYSFGQYVEQDDFEAIKWYRLAAEQGDRVAQNNLASYLIDENIGEAIKWYIASAEQNLPFAQEALGDIYSNKFPGCEQYRDDYEAINWYKKAAKNGFVTACHRIAEIWCSSLNIPNDYSQAHKWFQLAAERGYAPSQLLLSRAYREDLLGLPKDSKLSEYWLKKYEQNPDKGKS
jgi:uncharacterized protein